MKTVVFISNFMGQGGAARVIVTIAEALSKQGYEVKIATFPFDGFEYPIPNSIEKIKMSVNANTGIKRKISRIKSIRELMKKNVGATFIAFEYFVGMETVVASIGYKNRVIVSERNDPNQVKSKFIRITRNYLFGKADVVVCQTGDAKASFPKKLQKKITVIMNPLKNDFPTWNLNCNDKVIVNFCRLVKQKNIPMLFDAFQKVYEKHSDYKLLVFGDGKEKENLISLLKQKNYKDAVTIKPFIGKIHEAVVKCRMFVSSSDFEGLSNSMLEAMAMGMPVVCTDCPIGGASMVIENGVNGFLTPVGDAECLADRMIKIIENNELALSLSQNAIKIKETLSTDKIVDEWKKII